MEHGVSPSKQVGVVPSRRARRCRYFDTAATTFGGGHDPYPESLAARLWTGNERQRVCALLALRAARNRCLADALIRDLDVGEILNKLDAVDADTCEAMRRALEDEACRHRQRLVELLTRLIDVEDAPDTDPAVDVPPPLISKLIEDLDLAPAAPPARRVMSLAA